MGAVLAGRRAAQPRSRLIPDLLRAWVQTHAPPALLGTYRRTFQNADRIAARDPGLAGFVGQRFQMVIKTGWIHIGPPDTSDDGEYYTAATDGRLTLLGYKPGTPSGFCSVIHTEAPPTGYYHWVRRGKSLVIMRVTFDPCLDRGAMMTGTWTKDP